MERNHGASGPADQEAAAERITSYREANRYLEEHYIAEHNQRYARAAGEAADHHRRRPTARQLDEIF